MPRLTRAQLRAQEAETGSQKIHEDNAMELVNSPKEYHPFSTELPTRPALGEVHFNKTPTPEQSEKQHTLSTKQVCDSEKDMKSDLVFLGSENIAPITAHGFISGGAEIDGSLAPEPVNKAMRDGCESHLPAANTPTPRKSLGETQLSKSPGKTSIAAHSSVPKTPKFDPAVHSEVPSASGSVNEDSFVGSIKSRTPATMVNSQEAASSGGDSFVENITSHSPSKYAARIEDSVEAMDALEEAIEQVSEELPKAIGASIKAPTKPGSPTAIVAEANSPNKISDSAEPKIEASETEVNTIETRRTIKSAPSKSARSLKSTPQLFSIQDQRRDSRLSTQKSPRISIPSTSSTKLRQSGINSAATGEATSGKRKDSTALSTSRVPFVPSKSTKPPTKAVFTLPGEAISAKMKAQREERVKQQEAEAEAARKRTEFKARPIPPALATVSKRRGSYMAPRENAASRARMSLIAARKESSDAGAPSATKHVRNGSSNPVRASMSGTRKSITPSTTMQPGLAMQKTRASAPATAGTEMAGKAQKPMLTVSADSYAVRRNAKTQQALSSKPRPSSDPQLAAPPSATLKAQAPPSNTNKAGTVKGKAAFNRPKLASEEFQRQRHEKEEAARKARAEAAERGRLASREWAAKQAQKKEERGRKIGEIRTKPADVPMACEG